MSNVPGCHRELAQRREILSANLNRFLPPVEMTERGLLCHFEERSDEKSYQAYHKQNGGQIGPPFQLSHVVIVEFRMKLLP